MTVTLTLQEYHELAAGQKSRLEAYHKALSVAVIEILRMDNGGFSMLRPEDLRVSLSKAVNAAYTKYLNPEGLPIP